MHNHDGMMLVRADLCERLESIQQAAGAMTVRDLSKRLCGIRTMAAAYGLDPVVSLADALERSVRAEPRGCPAALYLERLRDAIGCTAVSGAAAVVATEAMLASVSVRLSA